MLNEEGYVQVRSVIDGFEQFGCRAAKGVALIGVRQGPSDPRHLVAHVRADDVRRPDRVVRVVDAQHGCCRIRNGIVNQFPVIFGYGNQSVVVLVERQINRLLDSVHVRQSADPENPSVDGQFHVPADRQISECIFQNAKLCKKKYYYKIVELK
jgi:hypothetical protein